jgi:hypothetical protein
MTPATIIKMADGWVGYELRFTSSVALIRTLRFGVFAVFQAYFARPGYATAGPSKNLRV